MALMKSSSAVLTPAWVQWIEENVQRGCSADAMAAAMQEKGFSLTDARHHIAASTRHVASVPATPMPQQRVVAGQTIKTLFAMAAPDIELLEGVLSPQECDELVARSRHKLLRSTTVNGQSGATEVIEDRTSSGTYFTLAENDLIASIDQRLSALTHHPVDHGEGLQVIHYLPGGEYKAHFDYFPPTDQGSAVHLRHGGQRVCTVVMYLNDVEVGGETHFPALNLKVLPKKGAALRFSYCNEDGVLDERSLHAGLPVIQGEKWIATKWIRQGPYV